MMKRKQKAAADLPVRFTTGSLLLAKAAAGGEGKQDEQSDTIAVGGVAYTGQVLHSFFGDVIADLDGMAPLKERGAALLYGHARPIGVVQSVWKTDRGLEYAGHMVRGTQLSDEIALLAKSGFPWQLSIRAEPDVIEELGENATAEVNGQTVTGPITIFRQWRLPEISIVELGLDGDTEASIAARAGGERRRRVLNASPDGEDMTEETEKSKVPDTIEALRELAPDLVAQLEESARASGVSTERARVTEILDATRQAIAAEDAKEGEDTTVEAEAIAVVASAVKDGAEAKMLLASLLRLGKRAVKAKACATPQNARRALTAEAERVETETESDADNGTAHQGPRTGTDAVIASAQKSWRALSANERSAYADEDSYIGQYLMASHGRK